MTAPRLTLQTRLRPDHSEPESPQPERPRLAPDPAEGDPPANILDHIEGDNLSKEWIAHLIAEAGGDPYAELALLKTGMEIADRHQERLQERRLEVVRQLREAGVPMTEIAAAAGVNDSYLSRIVIKAGAPRRSDRTRVRRRRRPTL